MTDPKSPQTEAPQTADPASYMGATPEAPDTNTNAPLRQPMPLLVLVGSKYCIVAEVD